MVQTTLQTISNRHGSGGIQIEFSNFDGEGGQRILKTSIITDFAILGVTRSKIAVPEACELQPRETFGSTVAFVAFVAFTGGTSHLLILPLPLPRLSPDSNTLWLSGRSLLLVVRFTRYSYLLVVRN